MAVHIRPAGPGDRAFVLGLLSRMAAFELPAWRTADEVVAGDYRPLAAWFDAPTADDAVLIAEIDGRPVGCAHLIVHTDFFTERPHTHLSVLAVAKDAEGRGVGSALLEATTAWAAARGDDHVTLNVFDNNRRARALYERHGYAPETIKYVKRI